MDVLYWNTRVNSVMQLPTIWLFSVQNWFWCFDFFFWLCKYFESDLAKVIQSQTICQPAITTFPLGLYWKTYLYLFLSKKIAPKWKVIQVSKISLLSKVRDKGGGAFFKTIKSCSQLSCEFCIYMGKKRTEKVAVQRIPPEYQGWWMSMWQARSLASP